jgi:hypothetical protein
VPVVFVASASRPMVRSYEPLSAYSTVVLVPITITIR